MSIDMGHSSYCRNIMHTTYLALLISGQYLRSLPVCVCVCVFLCIICILYMCGIITQTVSECDMK